MKLQKAGAWGWAEGQGGGQWAEEKSEGEEEDSPEEDSKEMDS